jgi:hypothetical protein
MAPTLEQSTDTHALGVDGNTPTSVAGDNYEGLTSKALKKLCSERDLAVRGDHAALVSRLRAGKKAGPKSSKERVSAHRTTRSQAKVVAADSYLLTYLLTYLLLLTSLLTYLLSYLLTCFLTCLLASLLTSLLTCFNT